MEDNTGKSKLFTCPFTDTQKTWQGCRWVHYVTTREVTESPMGKLKICLDTSLWNLLYETCFSRGVGLDLLRSFSAICTPISQMQLNDSDKGGKKSWPSKKGNIITALCSYRNVLEKYVLQRRNLLLPHNFEVARVDLTASKRDFSACETHYNLLLRCIYCSAIVAHTEGNQHIVLVGEGCTLWCSDSDSVWLFPQLYLSPDQLLTLGAQECCWTCDIQLLDLGSV